MKIKKSLTTRLMLWVGVIIICTSVFNLLWSLMQYERQAQDEMKDKASVIAQQMLATRAFIAEKQDVINYDAEGNFQFKYMNPAAVGKGVGHIFAQYTEYQLKQTRLETRAPENVPHEYEFAQMTKMASDPSVTEVWDYDYIDGQKVFRHMLPLYYTQECMPCHGGPAGEIDIAGYAKEGAQPGEFAGAISVVFTTENFENNIKDNIIRQLFFAGFILIVTIISIYLVMTKIVITPLKELTQKTKELGKGDWDAQINPENAYDEMRNLGVTFNVMAGRLQDIYSNMEEKVKDRTRMLQQANLQLSRQSMDLQQMNDRLSEADRLKSEFLAVMSHELKTPLTSIIAFSELLLTEQQDQMSLQAEYLNDILESAHALHSQIDDILSMSKIEAGLVGLDYRRFHIEQIFQDLSFSFDPLFERKGIRFCLNIHVESREIEADYDKVKHIIQNLLSNAVKFTPDRGHITVDVSPYQDAVLDGIQVRISDDGIGIRPEDMPNIFNKFWQTSDSNKENSGSGLGLAIVKNFVELHGGRIEVSSTWQYGTAFTFVLPASKGDA